MKVSVCITTYNEVGSISDLLDSLLSQSKKANEIIIVDSQSQDGTKEIIKKYAKSNKRIIFITKKCTRSEGRNLAIKNSKNKIIAITDAGCVPKSDWLYRIVSPFTNKKTDVVAGFYDMKYSNSLEQGFSIFLGVSPNKFNSNFLPSTRSVAFRKNVWQEIGGFPEELKDTAEDTLFNFMVIDAGFNMIRSKDSIVEWSMPKTIKEFMKKISSYAEGDSRMGVYYHKAKGFSSHNIKALLVFVRYFVFLSSIILGIKDNHFQLFFLLMPTYLAYSIAKVTTKTRNIKSGFWGIILQPLCDVSVMKGFLKGIKKC